ncbi:MAG: hypothetical protein PWP37_396 [Thermotogota bacterium]|nr:hypothetical protein [Thermotogota bacterium]MDK2864204.1 hypothetical protein [Thermotogota bacterium]
MGKYRLILVDLDGTLLDSEKRISEENKKVLHQAVKNGLYVTIVTGRSYVSAIDYVRELDLKVPVVFQNGALIYDFKSNAELFKSTLPAITAIQLVRLAKQHSIFSIVYEDFYTVPDMIIDEDYAGVHLKYLEANMWRVKRVPDLFTYIKTKKEVAEVAMVGGRSVISFISKQLDDGISVVENSVLEDEAFVEFFGPGSTKAHALDVLLSYFQVSPSEVVFIGDNLNDVSLMKRVGMPIAMGNAVKEVKEAARWVTTTNDEDGVAEAVKILLEGDVVEL